MRRGMTNIGGGEPAVERGADTRFNFFFVSFVSFTVKFFPQ